AIFQNAGFTRHSALRFRAACGSRKDLVPSAPRRLFGNRDRETRIERRTRCASETPDSNSYSIANTNIHTDPKANANAHSNSDPNITPHGDSNVYADRDSNCHSYGDVHADTDGDCNGHGNSRSHSYTNPYSHRGCACFAWRD